MIWQIKYSVLFVWENSVYTARKIFVEYYFSYGILNVNFFGMES